MNRNEQEPDQLTHKLLKSATLEPSADLDRRIMERIAKEQPLTKGRPTLTHLPSCRFSPWLVAAAVVAYFAVAILILYMYKDSQEDFAPFDAVKEKIPYLLTVAAVFGSFPFFRMIDRALS
jgi:hypothetical protein